MEQLNKVELRGSVGSVKIQNAGQGRVAHFTLATNYAYKDHSGAAVIETTWHNVTAWEGKTIPDLGVIEKGSRLYVFGRLKSQKYSAADGTDRTAVEIQASRVSPVDVSEPLSCEF